MSGTSFNPLPGVPKLQPAKTPEFEMPGGGGQPEPIVAPTEVPAEDSANLDFDIDFGKVIDDNFFDGMKPSIYTDLDPVDLYIKDQAAMKAKKDQNFATYFSRDNLHKTTQELYGEEQNREESANFLDKVNWMFDNEYELGDMDNAYFQGTIDDMDKFVQSMPVRPERPQLEMPSDLMMGISGFLGLVLPPGQGSRAMALPFQYMLHKNAKQTQEGDQRYEDRLKEWQVKFGIKREQAKMIADRQIGRYEARQKDIEAKMKLRYGAIEKAEDFNLTREKMRQDLNIVLFNADAAEKKSMLDNAFSLVSGGKSPELRMLGQEFISIMTGIQMDPMKTYTPAELVDIARSQGIRLENQFNSATLPARIEGTKAAEGQKIFDLQNAPAKLAADLADKYSMIQNRTVQALIAQDKLKLDYAKFAEEIKNGAKEADLGKILAGVGSDLQKAQSGVMKEQTDVMTLKNAREAKVKAELEKKGEFKKPGIFGWAAKEVEAHNKQVLKEALIADPEYSQLDTRYKQIETDLADINSQRTGMKYLSPESARTTKVNEIQKALAGAKTPAAYMSQLQSFTSPESVYQGWAEDKLAARRSSTFEVLLAIDRVPIPGGGDREQLKRSLLSKFAMTVLNDPGLTQSYVDAMMKQMSGESQAVGGGALGAAPFMSPSFKGFSNGKIPRDRLSAISGAPGHYAAPEAASGGAI